MFKFLRALANNRPFQIVLGILLGAGFISFGLTNFSPAFGPLVKMDGGNISISQFQTYYQSQLAQNNAAQLTPDQQKALDLPKRFLQQMIIEKLLEKVATDMNLRVSNHMVAEEIKKDPTFQDPTTGQFSKDRYLAVIKQGGISEGRIIAQTRKKMLLTWLQKYFVGLHFTTPALAPHWQGDNGRIAFTYLAITADRLIKNGAPAIASADDAALEKFYNNNLALYQKPRYRRFQILTLPLAAMKNAASKKIAVTDQDLKAAYEASLDQFAQPASYEFEQLLFQDKKTADDFLTAHPTATPLPRVANGKYNTITLGDNDLSAYGFAPADAVGKRSSVIETPFGFAIIRLTKKTASGPKPLSAVAAILRAQIAAQKTNQAINDLYRQVGDQLAAGKDFATVLKGNNITGGVTTTTGFIDNQGRDKSGVVLTNQPYLDKIIKNGFDEGIKTTPLIVTDAVAANGALVAVALAGDEPPSLPPFATIKTTVAADWKKNEERKLLLAEKEKIDSQLTAGQFDFSAYQKTMNLTPAKADFGQKQIFDTKPVFNGVDNNSILRVLFAPAATALYAPLAAPLATPLATNSAAQPTLFIMQHTPSPAPAASGDLFQKQLRLATGEGWLLDLYRTHNVRIDWKKLDGFLN